METSILCIEEGIPFPLSLLKSMKRTFSTGMIHMYIHKNTMVLVVNYGSHFLSRIEGSAFLLQIVTPTHLRSLITGRQVQLSET